jgi:hypothetical protein
LDAIWEMVQKGQLRPSDVSRRWLLQLVKEYPLTQEMVKDVLDANKSDGEIEEALGSNGKVSRHWLVP